MDEPDISRCILCRFDGWSELFRDAEFRVDATPEFSCPNGGVKVTEGVELPTDEAEVKARLDGLRGDVRGDVLIRVCALVVVAEDTPNGLLEADLADRSDSFTLGRKGVARGDWA